MVVERESGQSLLEFLLMLPMMVGVTLLLVKVNSAIQVGIVNQQYARAQTLWLAFNSPVFPRAGLRQGQLDAKGYNQMLIGVSENAPPEGQEGFPPKATVMNVGRKRNAGGSDAAQEEPTVAQGRSKVRVRTTVALCTQPNVIDQGGSVKPLLELKCIAGCDAKNPLPKLEATSNWRIGEQTRFQYCRSPLR